MKRLIALLLLCAGCAFFSQITPEKVAQHLMDDRECFAAAVPIAEQIVKDGTASLFGISKGTKVDAAVVVAAVASGKASEVPLTLFVGCQKLLNNLKADVAAIKAAVKK